MPYACSARSVGCQHKHSSFFCPLPTSARQVVVLEDVSYACMSSSIILVACPCSDHIKQWVRQASKLQGSQGDSGSDGSQSPQHKSPQHHRAGHSRHDPTEADAHCAVRLHAPGSRSKGKFDEVGSQTDEGADSMRDPITPKAQSGRFSENGGDDAASFAGSMADGGMSDAGSGVESSMATGAVGHEEDLAVDMR